MGATSIDLSQIKTDALDSKATFRELIGASSGEALPVVTITDAAVSMVANTRYQGSIAAFTADRTYTLPAGTAGDIIEVFVTTGDDAYELILLGASGVSINGGSAATEWSRLFISNEFVRFRCFATNDWRVEADGRANEKAEKFGIATTAFVNAAHTRFTLGGFTGTDSAMNGTNEIVVRRSGVYAITGFCNFQPSGGTTRTMRVTLANVGAAYSTFDGVKAVAKNTAAAFIDLSVPFTLVSAIPGQAFSMGYYTDGISGTNQYLTSAGDRPSLQVWRVG